MDGNATADFGEKAEFHGARNDLLAGTEWLTTGVILP